MTQNERTRWGLKDPDVDSIGCVLSVCVCVSTIVFSWIYSAHLLHIERSACVVLLSCLIQIAVGSSCLFLSPPYLNSNTSDNSGNNNKRFHTQERSKWETTNRHRMLRSRKAPSTAGAKSVIVLNHRRVHACLEFFTKSNQSPSCSAHNTIRRKCTTEWYFSLSLSIKWWCWPSSSQSSTIRHHSSHNSHHTFKQDHLLSLIRTIVKTKDKCLFRSAQKLSMRKRDR